MSITDRLPIGGDLLFNSDQFLRGDESNQFDTTDSYAAVNLHGQYTFNKYLSAFVATIENLFHTDYETFGLLGDPTEVSPGFADPRFLGPGAPRGAWIGVKIALQPINLAGCPS